MAMTEISARTMVDAPAAAVWRAMTDWRRQQEWMLGTSVRVVGGDGETVGSELAARTKLWPLQFTDTMEITVWEPPLRCEVRHTGRLVRGVGVFEVSPRGTGAEAVWTERLDLPFGALGRCGWPVARPVFAAGLRASMRRLAKLCEL